MKKTGTVASLILIGAMACSTAVAATGTMSATSIMWLHVTPVTNVANVANANTATHAPAQKARPALAKKKFRYLDMVERKHPSSIRNAVIVYDHADMKKKACDASDPATVSECLGRPSV